jgi:hypothetical protein
MFVSQSQTLLLVTFCQQLFLLRQRHLNESQTIRRKAEVKRAVLEPDSLGRRYLRSTVDQCHLCLCGIARVAEVYFPSMQAPEACAASEGGKEAVAHAAKVPSGRAPIFLVAEEETITFTKTVNA